MLLPDTNRRCSNGELGDIRRGDAQRVGEFADSKGFPLEENRQDPQPGRIRQQREPAGRIVDQ